jgi:formate/nitrite transporter FocA (FNT family)
MPMALMKGRIKVWELPLNWLIVFFGNLAGALCLDAFMGGCGFAVMMKPSASIVCLLLIISLSQFTTLVL